GADMASNAVSYPGPSYWKGWLRGQSRANPSLGHKFPASWENTGNFVDSASCSSVRRQAKRQEIRRSPDQFPVGTGNFGSRAGNSAGRSAKEAERSGTGRLAVAQALTHGVRPLGAPARRSGGKNPCFTSDHLRRLRRVQMAHQGTSAAWHG